MKVREIMNIIVARCTWLPICPYKHKDTLNKGMRSAVAYINISALKALLDGRVRLGESQVRLTESKCCL